MCLIPTNRINQQPLAFLIQKFIKWHIPMHKKTSLFKAATQQKQKIKYLIGRYRDQRNKHKQIVIITDNKLFNCLFSIYFKLEFCNVIHTAMRVMPICVYCKESEEKNMATIKRFITFYFCCCCCCAALSLSSITITIIFFFSSFYCIHFMVWCFSLQFFCVI